MAFPLLAVASGASALYNMFKKKPKMPNVPTIDTSGILAEIDKLYAAQEQSTQANMARNLAGTQAATSESLAGRGVYSSPVSEWSFAKNRSDNSMDLSNALAALAGQKASTKAGVLSSAASLEAKQRYEAALAKYQNQMESSNMLTGLLSSGALAALGAGSGTIPVMEGLSADMGNNLNTDWTNKLNQLLQGRNWQNYGK